MRKRFVGVPVVVILAAAGAVGTSAGTPASARTVPGAVASPSGSVTLITGDRVELNGGTPPQITPGPGRRSMPFRVSADKGHLQVVPGDAATLVATGRLDQRLFDVTTLLEDGYGDTQRKDLSLIVQYDAGTPHPLTAAENTVRQLSSVHGASIAVSKKDAPTWWNAATHLDRATRTLDSGLTKVWLNGRRHLAEDANATQIGAPVAWQAGLTGKNVRVAIIDGGIATDSPYEYELAGTSFGQLFTGLRLHPAQKDFATVDAQYDAVTDQPRDVKTAHVARPASGPEGLRLARFRHARTTTAGATVKLVHQARQPLA